jgi:hypothetical protein
MLGCTETLGLFHRLMDCGLIGLNNLRRTYIANPRFKEHFDTHHTSSQRYVVYTYILGPHIHSITY